MYSGLHLAVIHPDYGAIDSHHLAFADHGTFTARDERWRADTYLSCSSLIPGKIRDDSSEPPWKDGDFTGLQEAVAQYVRIWFNTTIEPLTPSPARRSRVRGVTALPTPAAGPTPWRPR